ncbi:hypothetical protein FBULB1_1925 [Fusarium bulbicola]|nr:hypothetical protein FBULB1_1925 [Fusarium bulbicola]
MASNSRSPLRRLPLEVVANILGHSGSIQELGAPIFSHSIFYNAFKANSRSIAKSIITTQIPEKVLPYALLLVEIDRLAPGDTQTLEGIIARFYPGDRPVYPPYTFTSNPPASPPLLLNTLTWSEYVSLSRDYEAVKFLRQEMAKECKTTLFRFGIIHADPLTTPEKFRLDRSFYLFQAISNTLCTEVWPNRSWLSNPQGSVESDEDWPDEYAAEVLSCCFSPWVNHQLQSVYRFLERNIVFRFRYIADNDVGYAGWKLRHSSVFQDCLRHDELFTRGLYFHSKVSQAKTIESMSNLRKPPSDPRLRWDSDRLSEAFRSVTYPTSRAVLWLAFHEVMVRDAGSLEFIQGTHDGEFDDLESTSCRSWRYAFRHSDFNDQGLTTHQSWLLDCAYTMWDYTRISASLLSERLGIMRMTQSPPEADLSDEEHDDFNRSRTQREQILSRGGEGWWPTKGVDFSRVTGLTDQDKEELLSIWRASGWVEPLKRTRSGSSSSGSSVEVTITVRRRYD